MLRAFVLFLIFVGADAFAANSYGFEDLRDSVSLTRSSASVDLPEHYGMAQSRLQLIVPSFVVHGMQPDPTVAAAMPRKMNSNGDEVLTPGFGLEYKSPGGFLFLSAVIKDCFDNLAGTMQMGEDWRVSKDSDLGLTMGIYARQTPVVCAPGVRNNAGCYTVDGLDFKFITYINGQSVDLIPLPFLHYSYNLYRSREWQMNFKVMANFIVNEVGLEIPL